MHKEIEKLPRNTGNLLHFDAMDRYVCLSCSSMMFIIALQYVLITGKISILSLLFSFSDYFLAFCMLIFPH